MNLSYMSAVNAEFVVRFVELTTAFAQSNTEAAAQPTGNVSQNSEWYCVCGNKNAAEQTFCSNCGAANPNNNQ